MTVHFNLYVPLITPGSAPGVFDEPVVQASGFISAIADNENAMVNVVKGILIVAVKCIDDAARVLMYVFIIGRNSDGNRLLLNGGLKLRY